MANIQSLSEANGVIRLQEFMTASVPASTDTLTSDSEVVTFSTLADDPSLDPRRVWKRKTEDYE
jgi:hypothetical protein